LIVIIVIYFPIITTHFKLILDSRFVFRLIKLIG
jgi:hypothetical protein